jgi:hypothetical protein
MRCDWINYNDKNIPRLVTDGRNRLFSRERNGLPWWVA